MPKIKITATGSGGDDSRTYSPLGFSFTYYASDQNECTGNGQQFPEGIHIRVFRGNANPGNDEFLIDESSVPVSGYQGEIEVDGVGFSDEQYYFMVYNTGYSFCPGPVLTLP